jgi:hypothetical protein
MIFKSLSVKHKRRGFFIIDFKNLFLIEHKKIYFTKQEYVFICSNRINTGKRGFNYEKNNYPFLVFNFSLFI